MANDKQNEKNECLANKDKCALCPTNGTACNNQTYEVDTCVSCYSRQDPLCTSNPGDIFSQKICNHVNGEHNEGCYMSIVCILINFRLFSQSNELFFHFQEGDDVQRGCYQDLVQVDKSKANRCLNDSDGCKMCKGKACNLKPAFQECHVCNSEHDPNCSRNPQLTELKTCKEYLSTCLTTIDANGFTQRDCSNSREQEYVEQSQRHEFCANDKCNNEIFPRDRLQCFQCSGEEECNFNNTERVLKTETCDVFVEYDQCFTYIDEGKVHAFKNI